MFPGSRLMYRAGVEAIKALRRKSSLTARRFHDRLLSFGMYRSRRPRMRWRARNERSGRVADPVLTLRNLAVEFSTKSGRFRAVDGVSLNVNRGQTVALVGESGSGKSVTTLSVMRLLRPPLAKIIDGEILFRGRDGRSRDLAHLDERQMRAIRGNEIA